VTGHTCLLHCGGLLSAPFLVSVDGSPYAQPITLGGSLSVGTVTLFNGLADRKHFVQIMDAPAFAALYAWTLAGGVMLTVRGANPSVTFLGPTWALTDPSFPGLSTYCHGTRTGSVGGANVSVCPVSC
jgi:hypothetical protein